MFPEKSFHKLLTGFIVRILSFLNPDYPSILQIQIQTVYSYLNASTGFLTAAL